MNVGSSDSVSSSGSGSVVRIPGRDPDPHANVEKVIKIGWTMVGIFMTGGIFVFLLDRSGYLNLPNDAPGWFRVGAIAVAAVNIGIWMWFPLDDLSVLRHWVRTRKRMFPGYSGEFLAIMFAMVLLLAMIGGAMHSAFAFGLAGSAVYSWNIFGFEYIRRRVRLAAEESHEIFSEQGDPWRESLLAALAVVRRHWTLDESGWFAGWQQQRHLAMLGLFVLVALLGLLPDTTATNIAYGLGVFTILVGEAVLAALRIRRDGALHRVEEELALA